MSNRVWLERLAEFLAAHPGKPVLLTGPNGWQVIVRDVRTDGDQIKVTVQEVSYLEVKDS